MDKIKKDNLDRRTMSTIPQFSMVYSLIDHRNDAIKFSKLCSETTRLRLVVPLEFSTFYDFSFLWSIRVCIMENCGRFVK